jgi:hypothetical protein
MSTQIQLGKGEILSQKLLASTRSKAIERRRGRGAGFGRRALVLVIGCISLLGLSAGATSAVAATQTFIYTGSEQTFTVPAGVSTIHVLTIGARGGKSGAQGGAAAEVQGDLSVKPGQVLYVEVGGEGGGGGPVSPGGFNGGGEGAGGGGGASDVRTAPRSAGLSPDTRLIVAAGGGGSGAAGEEGAGAGGAAGEAGGSIPNNEGGGAGTAGSGGSGGSGGCAIGAAGELGLGGAGGNCENNLVGGGGGGGYYGGGGGGAGFSFGGGGGGGGSSLTPAGGKSMLAPFSAPEVQITYTSVSTKPEVGRCVATTGGNYQNSACTTKASSPGTGKYEWQPWPFTKAGFALTNGSVTLKTAINKITITCVENDVAGEYTGLQTATLGITFSECKVLGPFGGQCTGEGAKPGEIVSSPLAAEFGLVDGSSSPPVVGWSIQPVSGEEFLSFQCGGTDVTVTGSVIATMTPVNKMAGAFKLNFSGNSGIQKPESLEGGEKQFLTLETVNATEQVGLTMNDSIANERLLEIRAIG